MTATLTRLSPLVALCALSACVDPTRLETAPVQIESAKGPVICQLYTPNQVLWDRATRWPRGLDQAKADELCREEGARLMR